MPLRLAQRPGQLRVGVEDDLRRLGVGRLPVADLRRLHSGPGLRPEGDDDLLAATTALRDEGKIGAIGLSDVTLDVLCRALPAGIACAQNACSLVSCDNEDRAAQGDRRAGRP